MDLICLYPPVDPASADRSEKGRFIWPTVEGGAVAISPAQLSYLLSGIDWRNPQETWRPTRAG